MHHTSYKIKFRTAYSQFYIADKPPINFADEYSTAATDSNNFWTEEAFADKLAVEEGILGVCTGTYSHVNCKITLLAHRPDEANFEACDQVVEGSLEIKSGLLQLLDCPDSIVALEVALPPGSYRVRVKTTGLDSITDEEAEADDIYAIEVWPESSTPRRVLKSYSLPY